MSSPAVMDTPYSPPSPPVTNSSATMSPSASPSYPNRPKRPLPKRSLRDRLSSEAADSITYPPAPPSTASSFRIPENSYHAQKNGYMNKSAVKGAEKGMAGGQDTNVLENGGPYRFRGNEIPSDDEDEVGTVRRYQDNNHYGQANGHAQDPDNSHSRGSSSGSADGYGSFENSNNNKKRKIPTSGGLVANSLSHEMASMSLTADEDDGSSHYYSAPATTSQSGTGLSGAGRGRFGRNGRRDELGRRQLQSSYNMSNADINKPVYRKVSDNQEHVNGDRGIISQAIADAASSSHNLNPGQANISLLDQHSQRRRTSGNTQFTFTYESETSNQPVWPGQSHTMSSKNQDTQQLQPPPGLQGHPTRKDVSANATQTSSPSATQIQDSQPHPNQQPRKPLSRSKRYALAARERRHQQEYNNAQHPPKEQDQWICQFCEYESIFNEKPRALMRLYEMKDEQARKKEEDKRRLLEKARNKGRRGKKGNKNQNKPLNNNVNAPPPPSQPPYDPANPGTYPDDEYFEDDYNDPAPVSSPTGSIPRAAETRGLASYATDPSAGTAINAPRTKV